MTIKAAVFDLGGVVIEFHPVELTQAFGKDEAEAKLYLDAIHHPDWLEMDRGTYTAQEIAQRIFERTGSPVSRTMEFFEHMYQSFEAIEPTWKFIKELKEQNIEIYLLSNMNMLTFNHLVDNFKIFKEFKDGVVSENVKHCKPEKEIFDIFLNQTGLNKDEFFFVDDTLVNVEKTKELGWNVFHYNKYNCELVQKDIWKLIENNS